MLDMNEWLDGQHDRNTRGRAVRELGLCAGECDVAVSFAVCVCILQVLPSFPSVYALSANVTDWLPHVTENLHASWEKTAETHTTCLQVELTHKVKHIRCHGTADLEYDTELISMIHCVLSRLAPPLNIDNFGLRTRTPDNTPYHILVPIVDLLMLSKGRNQSIVSRSQILSLLATITDDCTMTAESEDHGV